jgi:uncharacterized protein (AIM24 family)
MTQTTPTGSSYTCPWCQYVSDGSGCGCPHCGSPIDVRAKQTTSGWYEMPPMKDMTVIHFGRSTLQIEGVIVPVCDMKLTEGEWVYFPHHAMLYKDEAVAIAKMQTKTGWNRSYRGFEWYLATAQGPGHVSFSRDEPGEMVAVPLQPGTAVDVREHMMVVANGAVTYDWFNPGIWFSTSSGDDTEYHYPLGQWMDRFSVGAQPGLVMLHAGGNSFIRMLGAGEVILIKPSSLLFKDASVGMQLHFEHPAGTWRSWRAWGNRYAWLRMWGPGRVAIQSCYPPFEDPGNNLQGHSDATRRQWQ